jgi:hypothetical protein
MATETKKPKIGRTAIKSHRRPKAKPNRFTTARKQQQRRELPAFLQDADIWTYATWH